MSLCYVRIQITRNVDLKKYLSDVKLRIVYELGKIGCQWVDKLLALMLVFC